jgi:hypothetical protein
VSHLGLAAFACLHPGSVTVDLNLVLLLPGGVPRGKILCIEFSPRFLLLAPRSRADSHVCIYRSTSVLCFGARSQARPYLPVRRPRRGQVSCQPLISAATNSFFHSSWCQQSLLQFDGFLIMHMRCLIKYV